MSVDSLLELCSVANVVHFPQGIVVLRQDNGCFLAGIATKDKTHFPFSATNKTAQGAMNDLKNYVTNAAHKYAQSKDDEAQRTRESVNAVLNKGGQQ